MKFARITSCVIFLCLFQVVMLKSKPDDRSFVAAVVEYEYGPNVTFNLENYKRYIKEAAEQYVDIIVFPEMTLTRSVEEAVRIPNPRNDQPGSESLEINDKVLAEISQSAKQYEIYVVVNVHEVMNCSAPDSHEPCPQRRLYHFNSNVVFDRSGLIISRYRKIHPFGQEDQHAALVPELGVFDTDFGVKFGHFICFDLLFQVPALSILQTVENVIFPTMWFSELPYLTAVQIQEAYAYLHKVNLFASGANRVPLGSAGSGIYSGRAGALISTMPGKPESRLLVATVSKTPGEILANNTGPEYHPPSELDSLRLTADPSLKASQSQLLEEGNNEINLREKNITCVFNVTINHGNADKHYRYRAVAFDGVRRLGEVTGGQRSCGVVACTGIHISTCGLRFPSYTNDSYATFEQLEVKGVLPIPIQPRPSYGQTTNAVSYCSTNDIDSVHCQTNNYDSVLYPVSVTSSVLPLSPDQFIFEDYHNYDSGFVTYTFCLKNSKNDLYSFSIWGRVFTTDGQDPTPARDSAANILVNSFLVFSIILYHSL